MLVATWMTGRIAKMNALAVFVALLFGAWLWGVWGMLLCVPAIVVVKVVRSEEHTSELQSLMRISYAVFCLKKKNKNNKHIHTTHIYQHIIHKKPNIINS